MSKLAAIGLITHNMAESLRFYELLGVEVPQPTEDHAEATLPNGLRLMWDTVEAVRTVDAEWQEPRGYGIVLAFECDTPEEVDNLHGWVVDSGFGSKAEPWDAEWGQRYAQVLDPDGYVVDLFAPLG